MNILELEELVRQQKTASIHFLELHPEVEGLEILRQFPNLEAFGYFSSHQLSLKPLSSCKLKKLQIGGKYKDIDAISRIVTLENLSFGEGITLENIDLLLPLKNLKKLSFACSIRNFTNIQNLKKLEDLTLNSISSLTTENLQPIQKITSLKILSLHHLPNIADFRWLKDSSIKILLCASLNGLTSLQGLDQIPNLEEVYFGGNFKNAKKIDAQILLACKKLKIASFAPIISKSKNNKPVFEELQKRNISFSDELWWKRLEENKFVES